MNSEDQLIHAFLDHLIDSATEPDEIHVCPICNGKIHVWFGGYRRGGESLFGIMIKCESCDLEMAVDYGVPPPSWVKMD